VHEKGDGYPWNLKLHGWHDRAIAEKLGKGWFMNVGPTGLRARITHEHPAYFTIKFVFDKSPAAGKIKAGDIVVGANGKILDVPHKFGRRHPSWQGPMTEMAKLIEDSQGKNGKLDLIVWPGGDKAKQKTVTLQLKPVGRFSPTYPFNCPRTDRLITALCDFLVQEYARDGKFLSRVHTHSACVLALMASGDRRYDPIIKKCVSGYVPKRYNPDNGGGFPTWGWGYDGIVMGEYYLLHKDRSLIPAVASLAKAFELGQDYRGGGFSHKPFPFIQKRIAAGGPKGYGAMSQPGGLAMIAMGLFEQAGLPNSTRAHERLHQAFLHSRTPGGEIGYGFKNWDYAIIELKDPKKSAAHSTRGVGYICSTGMKDIGEYTITWPDKNEKRAWLTGLDTRWVKAEAGTNIVYQRGGASRLVIRNMTRREPTRPYQITGKPIGHYGRAGQGALAHHIGGASRKSWKFLGDHYANACASSPNDILRGHASTLMGTLWGSLGAVRAEKKRFRAYMDQIKWWFIMAETHDGGFVVMPGNDYASTDHVYGHRNLPTATAALILSVNKRRLQITGAESTDSSAINPLAEIQSDGFKVVHCLREAKYVSGKGSFSIVLRSLDLMARRDNDRGKEAVIFADRLRKWLAKRNQTVLDMTKTHPAKSLIESEVYLRRIRGLDESKALTARMNEIKAIKDIRTLIAAYKERDRLVEYERMRGRSQRTEASRKRLITTLEKYVLKADLDKAVLAEAKKLLSKIQE